MHVVPTAAKTAACVKGVVEWTASIVGDLSVCSGAYLFGGCMLSMFVGASWCDLVCRFACRVCCASCSLCPVHVCRLLHVRSSLEAVQFCARLGMPPARTVRAPKIRLHTPQPALTASQGRELPVLVSCQCDIGGELTTVESPPARPNFVPR